MPLKVLDVAPPQPEIACDHRLVLSRPDQHVAWRDNLPLSDPLALIGRIRGAAGETGHTTPAGEVDARRREENGSNQKTGTRP